MANRVLVVDDEIAIREVIKTSLMPFDIETTESARGDEAILLVALQKFDAILLDINMPGRSGVETCRAILVFNPTILIIMLTFRNGEGQGRGTRCRCQ